nr:leucine-rich repeat domain-containing protein [uncultured Psychroserpens sp.]
MRIRLLFTFFLFSFVFANAQIVDIPDANFKNALLNTNCAFYISWPINGGYTSYDVDSNNDGEIQVSEAEAVKGLRLGNNSITSLIGLEYFTNLEYLNCEDNLITDIDVSNSITLEYIECDDNGLLNLNVSNCINLVVINCSENQITNINLSNTPSLEYLNCSNNELTNIDVNNNNNIKTLYATGNPFISVDVAQNPNLEFLALSYSPITELDVSQNPNLENLEFPYCQVSNIDLSNNPNLIQLYAYNNQLTNLDVSNNFNLERLWCFGNPLEVLNIKNGSSMEPSEYYNLDIAALDYICADENEIEEISTLINPNTTINTYCSFAVGGNGYSVSGDIIVDFNNDGCDINDTFYPNLKFNIDNGNNDEIYIGNSSGSYALSVTEGAYTISPIIENPDYFSISPNDISVDFPSEESPYTQDFCVTTLGLFNDLEINLIPINQAVPGFDAIYKITYRNIGTNPLSGSVVFDYSFDNEYMQYVSSVPSETSEMNNMIAWDYDALAPLETREIFVTFELNTPTDPNFPLNSGFELNFAATIYPLQDDETPNNNDKGLKQFVINSYDPNDITCLEGETISPEKVGEYVNYLIRFENLGTANATNIVVKNNIDDVKFNINTLVPLDGSHDYYIRINTQNDVEFIFENINLPFDDATNDGYVLYKIKTLESLVLGDTFSNQAEIYFDFNAPIITNTYTTEVAESLSTNEFSTLNTRVYPNPVDDLLTIESDAVLIAANIYDINGRAILSSQFDDTRHHIDVSHLQAGIYFLKVFSNIGNDTLKVVIE